MGSMGSMGSQGSPDAAEQALCRAMEAYLDGRMEGFDAVHAALARRVRGYLLSLCRDRALAEDLAQDTFLQMHRSRRTYEPGRPVTPWVFAIARHVFLMNRRSTGRRLRFEHALEDDAKSDRTMIDTPAALAESDAIHRALESVPDDQREALLLHHVDGWSFSEIAARLGIRVGAAKTRAFRGMRKMRAHLSRRSAADAKADR
jgi:RNA polymerase sigma-70 factor, ECF subfamily